MIHQTYSTHFSVQSHFTKVHDSVREQTGITDEVFEEIWYVSLNSCTTSGQTSLSRKELISIIGAPVRRARHHLQRSIKPLILYVHPSVPPTP